MVIYLNHRNVINDQIAQCRSQRVAVVSSPQLPATMHHAEAQIRQKVEYLATVADRTEVYTDKQKWQGAYL